MHTTDLIAFILSNFKKMEIGGQNMRLNLKYMLQNDINRI